jgi:hypothetical protein
VALRSPQEKINQRDATGKRTGHLGEHKSMSRARHNFLLKSTIHRTFSGKAERQKANPAARRKFLASGKSG